MKGSKNKMTKILESNVLLSKPIEIRMTAKTLKDITKLKIPLSTHIKIRINDGKNKPFDDDGYFQRLNELTLTYTVEKPGHNIYETGRVAYKIVKRDLNSIKEIEIF